MLSWLDAGIMKNRAWHKVSVDVAINQKVTLWPILSVTIPKAGAKKAGMKNTILVILAALLCLIPYLATKKSFEMLLNQKRPIYVKTQFAQINQNGNVNFLMSLQWNSSFSSSFRAPLLLSTLFACRSNRVSTIPQAMETIHRINPKVNAHPRLVASAKGGIV